MESLRDRLLKGISDESLLGEKGWKTFAELVSKSRPAARKIAGAPLPGDLYIRLGWYLSPRYLAYELIVARLSQVEDQFIEELYDALIDQVMIRLGDQANRELAVQIVKWAHVEAQFVPCPTSYAFERRVHRLCRKFLPASRTTRRPDLFSPERDYIPVGADPSAEEVILEKASAEFLTQALATLTTEERNLLEMTAVDEMSMEEAARLLELTPGAAQKILDRAMEKVRKTYSGSSPN